jgi:peptide/nickel transport system substrate-binding protein
VKQFAAAVAVFAIAVLPCMASAEHAWTQPHVLRIGVARDIDTLNPVLSAQAGVTDLDQLIFSGLIRYDDHGEAVPDVALAVPTQANGGISADGRTITYHLRPNVRFSDGVPLTADDVVFTWHAILNHANNVPYVFPNDQAESVIARDAHTVVVHLKAPSAPFIAQFMRDGNQGAILPKHLLAAAANLNRLPYNLQPVGSGPFVVAHYTPGVGVELIANPLYWAGRPKLDRISYRIIPNENSLLIALQTHAIDLYWGAPEQQVRSLRALDGVHVDAVPSYQFEQIAFNARRAPFDDVHVRQAAAYAIDWATLSSRVYLDVDLPGVGDVFPGSWAADPSVKRYPHDLDKARALLDAAGWHLGPDGIRSRNGARLEADIVTVTGIITRANAEVLIQQNLRDIGMDVQVRNAPASMLFSAYAAGGTLAAGKFDLAIYSWVKVPDPDDTETIGPDRVPPAGANFSGVRDPELGRLQRAGTASYDRRVRKAIYAKIQRRIQELVPYQTIVWRANVDVYNDDLRNFRAVPALSDFWNAAEWSI